VLHSDLRVWDRSKFIHRYSHPLYYPLRGLDALIVMK
jgi:hypothetical protein